MDVAALLVADERDRAAAEAAQPGDDRRVVGLGAVAVELDEVVADPLHVVERVRPVLMAGELDRVPDLVGRRLGRDPLDLALELRQLARDADAADERQVLAASRAARAAGAARPRARAAQPRAASVEEREEPAQERAQVGAADDRVEVAEAAVRLGQAEVVGELLAGGLLHDARAGEDDQRAGLG